jgi:hypothetical protein
VHLRQGNVNLFGKSAESANPQYYSGPRSYRYKNTGNTAKYPGDQFQRAGNNED